MEKRIRRERKKYLWNGKLKKRGEIYIIKLKKRGKILQVILKKRGKRDTVKKGGGNLCIEKTLLS